MVSWIIISQRLSLLIYLKTGSLWLLAIFIQFPHLPLPFFLKKKKEFINFWLCWVFIVAKVLEFPCQHQSFQWIFRTDFLWGGLVGCPWSPRDSQESSPTPQSKSINSLVLSFLYSTTLISIHDYDPYKAVEKNIALTRQTFASK